VEFIELTERAPTQVGPSVVTALAVRHPSGSASYGLRVQVSEKTISYSGDTEWTENLVELARDAAVGHFDRVVPLCCHNVLSAMSRLWYIRRQRQSSMSSCRRGPGKLLISAIVCLLLCGIVAAELPELLTLTDNTANDFTVCKASSVEGVRVLSAAKQSAIHFAVRAVEHRTVELTTVTVEGASPTRSGLFILHSVLRR
jgi:hypothetical protein